MNVLRKLPLLSCALALSACGRAEEIPAAAGVFEATETIISSEASGRLAELNVAEGDPVEAGAVVGRIDCHPVELERAQLEAQMKGLDTRSTDVSTQVAALREQVATAERERARVVSLGEAVPRKQLDDADAQLGTLRLQLSALRQSLTKGNRMLDDDRVTMQAQMALVDDRLGRCEIRTPVAGTVLVKYAEQGEYTVPGKAILEVADTGAMFLRAYVTADQLSQMKLGEQVKVYADFGADDSHAYDGTISWVATQSEFTPKTILTRDERANQVYAMKVAVKNDGYLKLGMYGYVRTGQ